MWYKCKLYVLRDHQVSDSGVLKAALSAKSRSIGKHHALRPWYRAQYGVATTLRKLGRYAEALAEFKSLLDLDRGWYGSSTSFVNVVATLPDCVYRYGGRSSSTSVAPICAPCRVSHRGGSWGVVPVIPQV